MEDEPVYKPRRARGTPAYKFAFKASAYFVGACYFVHLILSEFNKDRLNRKIASGWYDATEFMKQKRRSMSNFSPIPNDRGGVEAMVEARLRSLENDAESTLDADL